MQNFKRSNNQAIIKYVIIANYFVEENIRKKNRDVAQNGLNR